MSIKKLDQWNGLQTISVPNGYDMTDIPDLTRDNLIAVIEKQGEIIDVLNKLVEQKEK